MSREEIRSEVDEEGRGKLFCGNRWRICIISRYWRKKLCDLKISRNCKDKYFGWKIGRNFGFEYIAGIKLNFLIKFFALMVTLSRRHCERIYRRDLEFIEIPRARKTYLTRENNKEESGEQNSSRISDSFEWTNL